jgi:hypothetical protein
MKLNIPLAMLLLAAAPIIISAGYHLDPQPEAQRCVDFSYHVVPLARCETPGRPVKVAGSIYPEADHRYYYGGFGGNEVGSYAWGGSDWPLAGHVYMPVEQQETVWNETVANSPQP